MRRKAVQFGLSTLLAGITFSAIVFSWAAAYGGKNAVAACLALILLAGVGGALMLLGARTLGSSLGAGSLAVLLAFLLDTIVPARAEGAVFAVCLGLSWFCWAYSVREQSDVWKSLQSATGLTCGLVMGWFLTTSIQYPWDSLYWVVIELGLLLITVAFFGNVLCNWGVRWLWSRRRAPARNEAEENRPYDEAQERPQTPMPFEQVVRESQEERRA